MCFGGQQLGLHTASTKLEKCAPGCLDPASAPAQAAFVDSWVACSSNLHTWADQPLPQPAHLPHTKVMLFGCRLQGRATANRAAVRKQGCPVCTDAGNDTAAVFNVTAAGNSAAAAAAVSKPQHCCTKSRAKRAYTAPAWPPKLNCAVMMQGVPSSSGACSTVSQQCRTVTLTIRVLQANDFIDYIRGHCGCPVSSATCRPRKK